MRLDLYALKHISTSNFLFIGEINKHLKINEQEELKYNIELQKSKFLK